MAIKQEVRLGSQTTGNSRRSDRQPLGVRAGRKIMNNFKNSLKFPLARLRDIPIMEVLTLGRFIIIGIAATLLHIGVALIALHFFGWAVFPSNLIAFLIAFVLAFIGHYHYTFRAAAQYHRALVRYFVISATAFAVNNVLLFALVKSGVLSDIVSVILAVAVIPLISFTASRLWGFRS
jgi:putative flippase GtrA